jgi:hypothetical protein
MQHKATSIIQHFFERPWGEMVPRNCIKEVPHSNLGGLAANLRRRELGQLSNIQHLIFMWIHMLISIQAEDN